MSIEILRGSLGGVDGLEELVTYRLCARDEDPELAALLYGYVGTIRRKIGVYRELHRQLKHLHDSDVAVLGKIAVIDSHQYVLIVICEFCKVLSFQSLLLKMKLKLWRLPMIPSLA